LKTRSLINGVVLCWVSKGKERKGKEAYCHVVYRFDKLVYLGVSKDRSSQLKIITALTRKYVT